MQFLSEQPEPTLLTAPAANKAEQLSGYGYIGGTVLSAISSGIDTNRLGFLGSVLYMIGNAMLAKGTKSVAASQAAQAIYAAGTTCFWFSNIMDTKSFSLRIAGNASSFLLAFGADAENKFVKMVAERRAAIAGGICLVSRAPFLAKAYHDAMEKPGAATYTMLSAVAIWTVSDLFYMASKTEKAINQPPAQLLR